MKRNVCEEKGGKVPEAKVGRCIRSKEKGLLDKYDGLATAAGARRNDEVTNQDISKYIQVHEGSLVRLTVVFRRSEEPREALLGEAGELSVDAP